MSAPTAALWLCFSNAIIWLNVLLFHGKLMPETLTTFYAVTGPVSRTLICGTTYSIALAGFVLPYAAYPVQSVFIQGGFNAAYLVFMGIYLGNKAITWDVQVACLIAGLALGWLGYRFHLAPYRDTIN